MLQANQFHQWDGAVILFGHTQDRNKNYTYRKGKCGGCCDLYFNGKG